MIILGGPCKVIAPRFDELSEQFPDAIFLCCLGDESESANVLMSEMGIRALPTFHFWKKGARVSTFTGSDDSALERLIKRHAQ